MSNRTGRPRARLSASRPATLPLPSSAIQTASIEHSLQDWLNQSISESPTTPLFDTDCPCCNRPNCEAFERLVNNVKKVEGDARLAAEIGQSLLLKHESHVLECSKAKSALEEQLDEAHEKIRQLEQLLMNTDTARQEIEEQKSKATWEWQKTQKTLQETAADLEVANARCAQLADELRTNTMEVDRLRIFKFMVRQADVREEALRAKLEDAKHELAISRKTELTLESKYKKLKTQHESMCIAYERLKLDHQELDLADGKQINLAWLKESNEKLRMGMLKLTSSITLAAESRNDPASRNLQNELATLIKELVSANNTLKAELLDCHDRLSESRSEIAVLHNRLERHKDADDEASLSLGRETSSNSHHDGHLFSSSAPQSHDIISTSTQDITLSRVQKLARRERRAAASGRDSQVRTDIIRPSPTTSSSMPTSSRADTMPSVVHRHYHYHVRPPKLDEILDVNESGGKITEEPTELKSDAFLVSSAVDEVAVTELQHNDSPFQTLRNHVVHILERLRGTDIRALNRRLRRAFDIFELSTMSNSIIENILNDVAALKTRFIWVEELAANEGADSALSMFFPLVEVVQKMLTEIGELRTTMNELQLEYVKKVQEDDARAEKEALYKYRSRQVATKEQPPLAGALAWLTSKLQLGTVQQEEAQDTMTHSHSGEHPPPFSGDHQPPEKHTPVNISSLHQGSLSSLQKNTSSNEKRTRPSHSASSSTSQPRPIPYPTLRASRSTTGMSLRRSQSPQSSALDSAALRKKKSMTLGLTVSTVDTDISISPDIDTDWKVGNAFGTTSWLGNK